MTNNHLFPRRRRACVAVLTAFFCCVSVLAASDRSAQVPSMQKTQARSSPQGSAVKIRLVSNGSVVATATLDNHETARQFAALLPLELLLKDYAATEKVADLPGKLSTRGAPDGYEPVAGDFSYYAPWGNLAIFHKPFAFSPGLVRLGRLDSGIDAMRRPGSLAVKIELIGP